MKIKFLIIGVLSAIVLAACTNTNNKVDTNSQETETKWNKR